VLGIIGAVGSGLAADNLERAIGLEIAGQQAAEASQKLVEDLDDETRKMLEEYRLLTQQLRRTTLANDDLAAQVEIQTAEIERLTRELEEIDRMRSDLNPLMQRMIETLGDLVERDTPFLTEERQARQVTLETTYADRTQRISERYRQLLEAYQIEVDYGRNIEAYRAQLAQGDGQQKMVDFLRLGRVALYYQTLDGKTGGVWDNQRQAWLKLDSGVMAELTRAIRIARKQLPPDLMVLPLLIPEEDGQ
jgi:predicted RNase H-like nuclease (RuvC/YqgF family)